MSTITTENLIVTKLTVETINGQPVSYFYSGTCDNSCSDDNCNGCDNCDDNHDDFHSNDDNEEDRHNNI